MEALLIGLHRRKEITNSAWESLTELTEPVIIAGGAEGLQTSGLDVVLAMNTLVIYTLGAVREHREGVDAPSKEGGSHVPVVSFRTLGSGFGDPVSGICPMSLGRRQAGRGVEQAVMFYESEDEQPIPPLDHLRSSIGDELSDASLKELLEDFGNDVEACLDQWFEQGDPLHTPGNMFQCASCEVNGDYPSTAMSYVSCATTSYSSCVGEGTRARPERKYEPAQALIEPFAQIGEPLPPLPPRLRNKPKEEQIASKYLGDRAAFEADLAKWEAEQADSVRQRKAHGQAKRLQERSQAWYVDDGTGRFVPCRDLAMVGQTQVLEGCPSPELLAILKVVHAEYEGTGLAPAFPLAGWHICLHGKGLHRDENTSMAVSGLNERGRRLAYLSIASGAHAQHVYSRNKTTHICNADTEVEEERTLDASVPTPTPLVPMGVQEGRAYVAAFQRRKQAGKIVPDHYEGFVF